MNLPLLLLLLLFLLQPNRGLAARGVVGRRGAIATARADSARERWRASDPANNAASQKSPAATTARTNA